MRHNTRGPWDSIKIKGRICRGNSGRLQSNRRPVGTKVGLGYRVIKIVLFLGVFYFDFLNTI